MVIPPSIGIHGGGQQGAPPGFSGCDKYCCVNKIKTNINILFFI
jgi:hypothetical protein